MGRALCWMRKCYIDYRDDTTDMEPTIILLACFALLYLKNGR